LGLFINSRKVIIRYPANSSNANPRGLDDNNIMEPNPQLRQISKNLQMSETDRLLKKATAVEKVLDDLLHDDDDDDPETEVQMMDIDDPLPEKMDVEDPIQAARKTQPELDNANLLMLTDDALTHADLKPYKM
jgi:hypothetical protein